MPSVLGALEERERAALVRTEELRVEMERVKAALADAEEAARRAVIAREEVTDALAGAADGAMTVDGPAAGCAGVSVAKMAKTSGSRDSLAGVATRQDA
ncbi:hypothetical protein [Streptomyces natalensis]|uniref:hypothetical protein n=1 Tax=Streptomyces natalensis TaxID=68242 RepID=UPI0004AB8A20|nr:hypothetical protein [Streptomyces natalensis]